MQTRKHDVQQGFMTFPQKYTHARMHAVNVKLNNKSIDQAEISIKPLDGWYFYIYTEVMIKLKAQDEHK